MVISSRNALTDTPRNKVSLGILASRDPVRVTHVINPHMDQVQTEARLLWPEMYQLGLPYPCTIVVLTRGQFPPPPPPGDVCKFLPSFWVATERGGDVLHHLTDQRQGRCLGSYNTQDRLPAALPVGRNRGDKPRDTHSTNIDRAPTVCQILFWAPWGI